MPSGVSVPVPLLTARDVVLVIRTSAFGSQTVKPAVVRADAPVVSVNAAVLFCPISVVVPVPGTTPKDQPAAVCQVPVVLVHASDAALVVSKVSPFAPVLKTKPSAVPPTNA